MTFQAFLSVSAAQNPPKPCILKSKKKTHFTKKGKELDVYLHFVCICYRRNGSISRNIYMIYSVMQSDRNSSKNDIFHEPTAYKPNVKKTYEQKINFARHKYGRVGLFKIRIKSLVQKL